MVSLRTKEVATAAPFVIGSACLVGLSTTVDGGRDAFLVRVGFWLLAFGALVCLVVWALHRGGVLEKRHAATEARVAAVEAGAKAAKERSADLEARIVKLEDAIACRDLALQLLSGVDDRDVLRTLLRQMEGKN